MWLRNYYDAYAFVLYVYVGIRYCEHSNLSIIHRIMFTELSFPKSGGVHDKLPIASADWWDILLPQA